MTIKTSIAAILFCILGQSLTYSRPFSHPGGMHTQEQLEKTRHMLAAKQQPWLTAYEALYKEAIGCLDNSPNAVEDFNVPGYYVDADGHRKAMAMLSGDAWTAYSCAVAYQLTEGAEQKQFAEQAASILSAWGRINKKTSGDDGDLATADGGAGLVLAAELLADNPSWGKEDRAAFNSWVRNIYLVSCTKITERSNNWGDWGILGRILSHYYLDDSAGLDADIIHIKERIDKEIAPDGSMPHETKRGRNGIWYTYFSIAPLTAACEVAYSARQVDLFHYVGEDNAGIEAALNYLFQYCLAPETWPHHENPNLPNPTRWPGNLYEAMAGIYENTEYEAWVDIARPHMVFGHHYAWVLPTLLRTDKIK